MLTFLNNSGKIIEVNIMSSIKKIILISVFVLFSSFLFTQQASAQTCCVISSAISTCDESVAKVCISIRASFVEDVINPGLNYDLKDEDGNDLNKVSLDNNSFIIQETNKIKFIFEVAEDTTQITLPSITNINFSANKSIEYTDIVINKHPNPYSPVDVTLNANHGVIKGGGIYSQPFSGLQNGNGGNISLTAKVINTKDIQVAGHSGSGGDVSIIGDYVITGGIYVQSIIGLKDGFFKWEVFGDAGTIAINGLTDPQQVVAFMVTGDIPEIFAFGVNPSDVEIQAKELIWLGGDILNSSGCDLSISEPKVEACDYGGLCNLDHVTYPFRRYCKNYSASGIVDLKSDGVGKDRGIFIQGGINNSAGTVYNDFDNTNIGGGDYTGVGEVGMISLEATNGLVYVGSIVSVGAHIEPLTVDINATWAQIKNNIITDNIDVKAWPDEIGLAMARTGNIRIRAMGNVNSEPMVVLGGTISSQGQYAFAPNGGNVIIESDYRIEGAGGLTVNTSGRSGGSEQDWYAIKGVKESPYPPNDYIFDSGIFCQEDMEQNEYYNGTDGFDAQPGGNGGNITIAADVIQWNITGGDLNLTSNGGGGGNGRYGGYGAYCPVDGDGVPPMTGFAGPVTHVIPIIGKGGAGGNGGSGGIIDVQAYSLHCFDDFDLSSTGGAGGTRGDDGSSTGQWGDVHPAGNKHTGNCDLDGWQGANVPVLTPPNPGGDGGNAGDISLIPMPTDKPVTKVDVSAFGGEVDVFLPVPNFKNVWGDPYPWYCTNISDQFETPCQNENLDTLIWTDGFSWVWETERTDLDVAQLGPAPYIGQKGPDGGDGGTVIINSLIDLGAVINYDVSGKDGKKGSQGQNSNMEMGGTGGIGGDGGDGGTIQGNFDRGQDYNDTALRGGFVGDGGLPGASEIFLPDTAWYFLPIHLGGICQNPDNKRWGDWRYSVGYDEIHTLPSADMGPSGLEQGTPGSIDSIPPALFQGAEEEGCLNPPEGLGGIVWANWSNNTIPEIDFIPDPDKIPDDFPEDIPILIPDGDDPAVPVWIPKLPPPDWLSDWLPVPDEIPLIEDGVPVKIVPWPDWDVLTEPNNPPTIVLNITIINGCLMSSPIIEFDWTYDDPDDDDLQSAYKIEIDDNPDFNSPDVLEGGDGTHQGYIAEFDKPYYWKIEVWDSGGPQGPGNELSDSASGQIDSIHHYPWPSFDWSEENGSFLFDNTTGEVSETGCFLGPCFYTWNLEDGYFSDGTPVSDWPGSELPGEVYFDPFDSDKTLTLSIIDGLFYICDATVILSSTETLLPPKWKEIPP